MPDTMKYKSYAATELKAEETDDEQSVVATIATNAVDRDNEVILTKGVDLKGFRENPVVLFAHRAMEPPIGRAAWIKHIKADDAIRAKVVFAKTEFAQEIFSLFKDGIMKAFSIGFNPFSEGADFGKPTEEEIKNDKRLAKVGVLCRKVEMLEFSAVPVPANREALAIAVSKGLTLSDGLLDQLGYEPDVTISELTLIKEKVFSIKEQCIIKERPFDWGREAQELMGLATGKIIVRSAS
jgi:phage head maturation protease